MRIGLALLTARPDGWRELRDAAVSVEDAGFDSLWVPDHIERTFGESVLSMYEAVGMLGAIDESTTRVTIGASVHNAVWKHPVHIVHAASTLAEISGGRFILGIGSGGRHYEYGFVDAPLDHPFSRFSEAVRIIRSLLDGEEVTYRGEYWKTTEAPNCRRRQVSNSADDRCPGTEGDRSCVPIRRRVERCRLIRSPERLTFDREDRHGRRSLDRSCTVAAQVGRLDGLTGSYAGHGRHRLHHRRHRRSRRSRPRLEITAVMWESCCWIRQRSRFGHSVLGL